jgi:hypothetical protein
MPAMLAYKNYRLSKDTEVSLSQHDTPPEVFLLVIRRDCVSIQIHLTEEELNLFRNGINAFLEEVLK